MPPLRRLACAQDPARRSNVGVSLALGQPLSHGDGLFATHRADGHVTTRPWPADTLGAPHGFLSSASGLYVLGQVARAPAVVYYTTPPVESTRPRPAIRYARFRVQGIMDVLGTVEDTAVEAVGPTCASAGHISGLAAFFPTGPLRAFLPDHRLAIASVQEFRIDVINTDSGDTTRTITEDYPPVSVTDHTWQRATQNFRDQEAQFGGFTNCRLEDLRPKVRPPIRAIFSDDTGRLWAEIPTPDGFDAVVFKDGHLIARFPFPQRDPSVAPFSSKGRLYVASVDSLGVQSVEVYGVHTAPPS